MEYFTDQNDLNKLDGFSSKGPNQNPHSKNIKYSVLDIFVTSIVKIKSLAQMCVDNSSGFMLYVIFISILVAVMSYGVPAASRISSFGGFKNLFSSTLPAFSYNNGVLEADKKFEMKLSSCYVELDSSIDEFRRENFDSAGIYITFAKRRVKMISYLDTENKESYYEIYSIKNEAMFWDGFSNRDLINMIPSIYIMMAISGVFVALVSALKCLFVAMMLTMFYRTTTQIIKLPMTLGDTYHLCFYSQTISILLVNTNAAVGYYVSSFFASIVGVIISAIVVKKALAPHMPDIDEIMDNFDDYFKKD